jgi:hypothetical protein
MSLWLSHEELVELTGFETKPKQRIALAKMNIPFRSRPNDGYPLVQRSLFTSLTKAEKRREPRLHLVG